jgi:predicted short-subunit dehydrogenase-like oxidoreductase (DUF2520 family)
MDIVLIGSGNVATVFGRKSLAAGHRILQVYSRNEAHANQLATRLGTVSTSYISTIEKKADLLVLALRDEALVSFVHELGTTRSVLAHVSGAVSADILRSSGDRYGVLYPLQSLRKEIEFMPPLTMLIDGYGRGTRELLKNFASSISKNVLEADDATRLKYHLAATIVNNFTNYLFAVAASFCEKENISFTVLQPIMEETVMRLRNSAPAEAQTGPAWRNDQVTIQKHLDILQSYPSLLNFYELFTSEIQKSALSVPR